MIVYFGFADPRPGGHLYSPSGPTTAAEGCFVKSGQTSGPASAPADVGVDGDGDDDDDDDGDGDENYEVFGFGQLPSNGFGPRP